MIEIQGNTLKTENHEYRFAINVWEAFQWGDYIIVLLDLIGTKDCINNIYALKDGRVYWQVQDQRHFKPFLFQVNRVLSSYAAVAVYEENPELLVANDTAGFRYLIDPNTGLIVGQAGWTK